MEVRHIFEVEQFGGVTVLNLRRGVEEIEFDSPPADIAFLLELVRRPHVTNIIVDCHEIDFLRSTALGFFVTIWKRVQSHGGQVVFCNVSQKALEILRATKLDHVWKIYDSRMAAVSQFQSSDVPNNFRDPEGIG